LPDVVLQIERSVSGPGEEDSCGECVARVGERVDPGPAGVGCIAGDETLKMAWNVAPLRMMGLPFIVSFVRFVGRRMICNEPMPGVTNGGAV